MPPMASTPHTRMSTHAILTPCCAGPRVEPLLPLRAPEPGGTPIAASTAAPRAPVCGAGVISSGGSAPTWNVARVVIAVCAIAYVAFARARPRSGLPLARALQPPRAVGLRARRPRHDGCDPRRRATGGPRSPPSTCTGASSHILFNALWIRQLGPAVEEFYGRPRTFLVFTASGVAGFALSNALGIAFTVGASGAVFGLLGAMVHFGRSRGGVYGLSSVSTGSGRWCSS